MDSIENEDFEIAEPAPDPLGEIVVRMPCYEPNSHEVKLTGRDLCRHVMFPGTTGCAKTSTMYVMLAGVIGHHADDAVRKPGLLIFDFKADGTTTMVRHLAAMAGRAGDVVVVDEAGATCLDPFACVQDLEDIDALTEIFMSLNPQWTRDNPYWEAAARKRIDHALTIYALTSTELSMAGFLEVLAGIYLRCGESESSPLTAGLVALMQAADPATIVPAKLRTVIDGLAEWTGLDSRTKSNETSTLSNYFAPLLSPRALGYFAKAGAVAVNFQHIVDRGAIVVVRANAARDPTSSSAVGRLAKALFYRVAQERNPAHEAPDRLIGMFADEYPLIASAGSGPFSDVEQLQTLRARRCFVVATTQGFCSLDRKIGRAEREALQINFNTWFFMNSHEPAVAAFAAAHMGLRERVIEGWSSAVGRWMEPVCPPGALAVLGVGDAFVALPDGLRYQRPVNMVRVFPPESAEMPARPPGTPLAQLRGRPLDDPVLDPASKKDKSRFHASNGDQVINGSPPVIRLFRIES